MDHGTRCFALLFLLARGPIEDPPAGWRERLTVNGKPA